MYIINKNNINYIYNFKFPFPVLHSLSQVRSNDSAHHDSSVLPSNRRKMNSVVLQQQAIRRLWITSCCWITMAALDDLSVKIVHDYLRIFTARTKQTAHLVVNTDHVWIVSVLIWWRHWRGGRPDQSTVRFEHPFQLEVERLHVLFVLLRRDWDVHFWTNVVQTPVKVNHVPTRVVLVICPILRAVNQSKTCSAIILSVAWTALDECVAERSTTRSIRLWGTQHGLHVGQVSCSNATDAVTN